MTLQKKVDPASVAAPKPTTSLRTGTAKYAATIGAGGQTVAMTITEVIAEEDGAWVATETATTPMGDMTDATTLEKGTLGADEAFHPSGAARGGPGVRGRQGDRHHGR